MKIYILTLTLLFFTTIQSQNTVPQVLRKNYTEAGKLSNQLKSKIEIAKKDGHDVCRDEMLVDLAGIYMKWSIIDQSNLKPILKSAKIWAEGRGKKQNINPLKYNNTPNRMLGDISDILRERLNTLDQIITNKTSPPKYTPMSTAAIVKKDSYFQQNEVPVFLSGFNIESLVTNYSAKIPVENFISLSLFFGALKEDGGLGVWEKHFQNRLSEFEGTNSTFSVLLSSSVPKWALTKYPGIMHKNEIEISHPQAKVLMKQFLQKALPLLEPCQEKVISFTLANEPVWLTAGTWVEKNIGPPSKYFYQGYREYLLNKYKTIDMLNKSWGTSISKNAFQKDRKKITPIGRENKMIWYDWCDFNQTRVTDWFKFLKGEIKKVYPNMNVDIKIINETTLNSYYNQDSQGKNNLVNNRHNGLNREDLIELQDLNGCDTRCVSIIPSLKSGKTHPYSTPIENYSINWLHQSISFDFQRSLAPEKPLFDSEWHPFSTINHRDPNVDVSHMQAAVWLAHIYGMSSHLLWALFRNREGKLPENQWAAEIFESLEMQPKALWPYLSSMMDVNALSKEITNVVQSKRKVAILYSEASAIQSFDHTNQLLLAYEALTYMGLKVGFVTEKMLANGKGNDYRWIISPSVRYCKNTTVEELQKLVKKGIKLSLIGDNSFQYKENGMQRENIPSSLVNLAHLIPIDIKEFIKILIQEKPNDLKPIAQAVDLSGEPAFGIVQRYTNIAGGKKLLFVMNVNNTDKSFYLKLSEKINATFIDRMTGKEVNITKALTLKPNGFYFISCE